MPPTPTTHARRRRVALGLAAVLAIAGPSCEASPPPPPSCHVGAVGDSLTVGVERHLGGALARRGCTLAWVDARGSRPTAEGVQRLAERAAKGQLPPVLVVGLGTNDRYRMADFPRHVDTVMRLANGRQVIWVDLAYGPVKGQLNGVLAQKARQYRNLTIMGWDREYWANGAWRASDGIHATPAGYAARADLMAEHARVVTK